jgi:hypothetical protein
VCTGHGQQRSLLRRFHTWHPARTRSSFSFFLLVRYRTLLPEAISLQTSWTQRGATRSRCRIDATITPTPQSRQTPHPHLPPPRLPPRTTAAAASRCVVHAVRIPMELRTSPSRPPPHLHHRDPRCRIVEKPMRDDNRLTGAEEVVERRHGQYVRSSCRSAEVASSKQRGRGGGS